MKILLYFRFFGYNLIIAHFIPLFLNIPKETTKPTKAIHSTPRPNLHPSVPSVVKNAQ